MAIKQQNTSTETKSSQSKESIGDALLKLECVLEEMVDSHGLQHGDVLALVDVWLSIHRPACKEVYIDGGPSPVMRYGPVV